MLPEIQTCVMARTDFIKQYFEVPESAKAAVEAFILEVNALGESCKNAAEFENRFAAEGFQERFNALLQSCTPNAMPVSAEEMQYSQEAKKEIWQEDKGRIAKDLAKDVLDSVTLRAESDAATLRRRAMSEADVLDDYTRATNAIDDVGTVFKFVKGLFKNKKEK